MKEIVSLTWVESKSYTGWKKMIGGKVVYLGKDRRAAEITVLTRMLADLGGTVAPVEAAPATVHGTLAAWEVTLQRQSLSDPWRQSLRQRVERVRTFVPDVALNQLTGDLLGAWAGKIRTAYKSPYSARNIIGTLHRALVWAQCEGRCTLPPQTGRLFRMPRRLKSTPIRFMTWEEFGALYKAASPKVRCWMLLAVNCGFTQADLATLTADMVDVDKCRLSRPRQKTGVWGQWALWSETVDLLRQHMNHGGGLAFTASTGKPLIRYGKSRTDVVTSAWARLLTMTGLKLGFRSIRKLGAQTIRECAGLEAAQLYLAHIGGSVCEKHYTRPCYGKLDDALNQLRGHFAKATGTP